MVKLKNNINFKYKTTGDKKWKYELLEEVSYLLPTKLYYNISMEHPYFSIKDCTLTIKVGYTWNGADIIRDFESLMESSLVHDCKLQILNDFGGVNTWDMFWEYSKGEYLKDAHKALLHLTVNKSRFLAYVVYGVVSVFYGLYSKF